ncbi:MAG: DnaT-like ssDNA-binding protein [Minisyncoccia bacterium]
MPTTTLIVDDGTGLGDSTSYIAVADAIAYAAAIGVTLPDSDSGVQITAWLLTAMRYLENLQYIGQQLRPQIWQNGVVTPGQALQWPRTDPFQAVIEQYSPGASIPWLSQLATIPPGIPTAIQNAQAQLVVEQFNGIVLFQSQQGGEGLVTNERIAVLSTSYDVRAISSSPLLPVVDALLKPLLVPGSKCLLSCVRR